MAWWNPATWGRKASATGPAIAAFHRNQPIWTPRDYRQLSDEAFVRNAVSYRCVTLIAQKAAMVPHLLVRSSGQEIENQALLSLLHRPNPMHSGFEFLERLYTHILLAGNGYVEKVGPDGRPPRELWALRPDRMKVRIGETAMPMGYEYEANGRKVQFDADPITGRSEIIHIRLHHPVDDFYGLSPVEPAAFGIDRHNEAGAYNLGVLQNGATPTGALVFKPFSDSGTVKLAPQEAIEAAEERLNKKHIGTGNAGKPMVLGGNVDWLTLGLNMEQLQLVQSKLDAAQDICISFGVPIELILPGQSTYNNRREANLAFHEDVVLPLVSRVHGALTTGLASAFGDDLSLEPDRDKIEALSLRREIKQEATIKLFRGGLISRNEAREELQFQPEDLGVQNRFEASVFTALATAYRDGQTPVEPLYAYLRWTGLLPADMTKEQFEEAAVGTDSEDELLAAVRVSAREAESEEDETDEV